jgi:hypothetical protein
MGRFLSPDWSAKEEPIPYGGWPTLSYRTTEGAPSLCSFIAQGWDGTDLNAHPI